MKPVYSRKGTLKIYELTTKLWSILHTDVKGKHFLTQIYSVGHVPYLNFSCGSTEMPEKYEIGRNLPSSELSKQRTLIFASV